MSSERKMTWLGQIVGTILVVVCGIIGVLHYEVIGGVIGAFIGLGLGLIAESIFKEILRYFD